jgi:hypothetical protein
VSSQVLTPLPPDTTTNLMDWIGNNARLESCKRMNTSLLLSRLGEIRCISRPNGSL